MPDIFVYRSDSIRVYGCIDLHDKSRFKIGLHEPRNFDKLAKFINSYLPSKASSMIAYPCFYTMTPNDTFIYRTEEDGVHYAYGFNGIGFKYAPMHGKIVTDSLIDKSDFSNLPTAMMKAKI